LFCQLCFLDSLKQTTIKNINISNPATTLVLPIGAYNQVLSYVLKENKEEDTYSKV
jgi:hypothetical protein